MPTLTTRPSSPSSGTGEEAVIAVNKISKTFPGTLALDQVSLCVGAGNVHALLGANGSGKSTLVKILTGVYQPDAGTMRVGERELTQIGSPNEANALGIAAVHQESPLVDTLTVAECVALFRGYPTAYGRVRWPALRRQTRELLEHNNVDVDPEMLAGLLSPAERALVGLAIALDRVDANLRLLVLDEVTASLPQDQANTYLQRVEALASAGTPVLMVTHRLAEVHELASHVTVLRDGRVVHQGQAGEASDGSLVTHMVGERSSAHAAGGRMSRGATTSKLWRGEHRTDAPVVLEVERLAGKRVVDASFTLRAGEIVGIAGRPECGVTELPLLLSGAIQRGGGRLRIQGRELRVRATPREFLQSGLALLPADRLRNGGVASLSVKDNVVLPAARRYWHQPTRERTVLRQLIEHLDVRPPSESTLFGSLSGGNQQKVLLGKWLLMGPSVLVLDDPTSGVDPGARETIFAMLRQAATEGLAVLLFSTEPEQLAAMCSRILVLRDGRIVTELAGENLTLESVTTWCYA